MTEHFVIVGAQRSGTTRLYTLLEQHPDICMAQPMRPEPKFFLQDNAVEAGYAEYLRRFFAHRQDERVLGEKSTSYIERDDAIMRLHTILPDAKLIFVLRDPVKRAYSNWRFSRAHGLETLGFESALAAEAKRLRQHGPTRHRTSVSPFAYTARGHYERYLNAWASVFRQDQFIILTSEQLFSRHGSVRQIFEQLALDPDVPLIDSGKVNASQGEAPEPPPAAAARLREQFRETANTLSSRWQVDVSPWR